MKRLDLRLVELQLAPSRTKAQELIAAGEVEIFTQDQWKTAHQPGLTVDENTQIRIQERAQTLKYVSRGGLKLEAALRQLELDVSGWNCLDLGLSTGGFTDCLLQSGARSVTGYDVGHGQLHAKLVQDPRLTAFEGVNVRDLKLAVSAFDLCVVDLSFISLKVVIPTLAGQLQPGTRLLALVKPQFEVGSENLNKKGVVRDESLFAQVEDEILRTLKKYGFSTESYVNCELKGQDGNQEFFVLAHRI